ncbi:hypothetical protein BDFG_00635 [Blastomyces dermatitidis ATCC 26199]|nr:hypothetical protein BDFG_00635 [Blastomyces dermatitidis ATCC 26199]
MKVAVGIIPGTIKLVQVQPSPLECLVLSTPYSAVHFPTAGPLGMMERIRTNLCQPDPGTGHLTSRTWAEISYVYLSQILSRQRSTATQRACAKRTLYDYSTNEKLLTSCHDRYIAVSVSMEQVITTDEKSRLAPVEVDNSSGREDGAQPQGHINNIVEGSSPSPPAEDWFTWMEVLGAFCLNLNTWGLMNAYGVFQAFYELDLLATRSSSDISWIGWTQAFLMFIISMIVGPIVDAGYLRSLLGIGSLLTVLGIFMTSLCNEYWQVFLAQAITMGLGFGYLYVPTPTIVSQYFHTSTTLAMGASSAGGALGGVIYLIIFTRLQPRIGFAWATRVLGYIVLATQLLPLILMKS